MRSAPPCPSCGYISYTPDTGEVDFVPSGKACPRCGVPSLAKRDTQLNDEPTPVPFDRLETRDGLAIPSPPPEGRERTKPPSATLVGEYRLVRKIGEGAMGAVYKAKEIKTSHSVALKVLFRHVAKKPRCVERFYREARVMASLDHPNIVKGLKVGEHEGLHYFVMEYVSGCSLQHWITRNGPLSVGDALHVTLAVAKALGYAHGQDLIHRDIKPDNILLAFPDRHAKPTAAGFPVQVKITDLGMAKVLDDDLDLTQTGYGVGTPCYMPLEQARNSKEVDGRCDIYALGCVLYCCLTGQPPFTGATLVDLVQAKEASNFRPARRFNSAVPQRLDLMIYKMVAKVPGDRYQTCADLIRDLESLKLAHPTLCLPRPDAVIQRPGPDSSGSGDPESVRPLERASRAHVATRVVTPEDRKSDVWHVRHKSKAGGKVQRIMTTAEVLAWIASEKFDPTTQASRQAERGFRGLVNYPEFKVAVLPRVTRAGVDGPNNRLRDLVRQVIDEDESRSDEVPPTQPKVLSSDGPLGPYLEYLRGFMEGSRLLVVIGAFIALVILVVIVLKFLAGF